MNRKYVVVLSIEQHQHLENLTSSGTLPARQMKRAQILLKSDQPSNWSYEQMAEAFDVSQETHPPLQTCPRWGGRSTFSGTCV